MISRVWHGWTSAGDAAAYETLLRSEILPGIANRGIAGYRGAHLLRRDVPEGVEFVTILWFDSLEAVREFAGPDFDHSVVPEEARRLLARFDLRSTHYETVLSPS